MQRDVPGELLDLVCAVLNYTKAAAFVLLAMKQFYSSAGMRQPHQIKYSLLSK